MKQRRLKIIAASAILLIGFGFLVWAMTKRESMPELTPAKLVANADAMDNQNVKVVGVISKDSSTWDAANSKLTFAIREPEGNETVDVIYTDLKPDNFTDGGNVFVEGIYNAEKNLVVATKLTTKCASKYEGAESATTQKSSY